MVGICRAAKRRGRYLPLFTDTEVHNWFSIYQTSGQPTPNSSFFLKNEGKLLREIHSNAGRRITDAIPSLSSQSERAKNTILWFFTIIP